MYASSHCCVALYWSTVWVSACCLATGRFLVLVWTPTRVNKFLGKILFEPNCSKKSWQLTCMVVMVDGILNECMNGWIETNILKCFEWLQARKHYIYIYIQSIYPHLNSLKSNYYYIMQQHPLRGRYLQEKNRNKKFTIPYICLDYFITHCWKKCPIQHRYRSGSMSSDENPAQNVKLEGLVRCHGNGQHFCISYALSHCLAISKKKLFEHNPNYIRTCMRAS